MAWMQCRSCSTKFAVGLLRCPQCDAVSELYAVPEEVIEAEQEQEAAVPKISVEGGPSNALGLPAEEETSAVETETEGTAPEATEAAAQAEPETSDATSAATDEEPDSGEGAAGVDKPEAAPAPKPAKKAAAKKAVAK
ncbi:hypothetical protein Caci_2849 [Catenulispora acidiphila DSM 44928]|uniref:Uncharacterized protein n=1 Tax=Catenulispora acidiphila (strain DSM 44928 / JCM 14897 / NBRC 102108 / NRRL B-24433 / ID139908) TaxID=479433 RepID=C7Q183_CATAD|nr:hypothetical protein [Catenulispora acidiphila]ACU71758.1 hypothetical protein Caci_2849 [Catenulispora acidiphila DSM 44928]